MSNAELSGLRWKKSSYSDDQNICVEVAFLPDGRVALRDSKDRGSGPILIFTPAEWDAFARGVADGEFVRPIG